MSISAKYQHLYTKVGRFKPNNLQAGDCLNVVVVTL